jgi:hypothetical protein
MSDREYVYIVSNDSTGTAFFMPEGFESNVTVHLWGAGGGQGYSSTLGGGGAYVSSTLSLSEGDFVEIFVGNPGTNGAREIGGVGGISGASTGLNVYTVLNGKTADNSAPLPGDDNNIGAGGGGGGATAVIINGNVIVAAAGGGGGAGGSGYQTGTVGNPGGVQTSPSGGSSFGGGGHGNSNYATGGGGGGGYPNSGENGYNVGDDVSGLVTGRGPAGGQGGYNFGGNVTINGIDSIAGGRSTEYYPTTLTLTEASSIRRVRYQKFRSTKSEPLSAWPKGAPVGEFLELTVGETPPNTTLSRDLRSPEIYGSFVYFIGPEPTNFIPTGTFFRTLSWDYWQPVAELGTASRPVARIANAGYPGYAVLVLERKFNVNIKDSSNTWKKVTAAYVKFPSSTKTFYRTIPPATITFASPGTSTFVVPPGVFSIGASVTGGGGGGGGGGYGTGGESSGSGGGGGSGYTSTGSISVTPGETLTVVVGAGGLAGASHYSRSAIGNGGNGGASTLSRGASTLLTAAAGNGGTGGLENQTVAGGTGFNNGSVGLGAVGTVRAGGNGGASTLASGAVGVASTGGGSGFAGITAAPSGTSGAGGAGGGASDGVGSGPAGDQAANGGAGGAGQITLSYSSAPIAEIVTTGGWKQITAAWTKINNVWKSILSSNDVDSLEPTTEIYTSLLTNEFVVPAGCTKIYASLIGGGGGGGGDDSPYGGAAGFSGSIVKSVINVTPGDVLTIGVGGGGGSGASHSTSGAGYGGSSSLGFGGGRGGSAGSVPQSGAGGGGGAASVLKINNVITAVAAGGGGGAGGGHRGPANTTKPSYANSAAFFGSAGQDKSGDGGGAGGGGGGFFGGSGGTNPGGDVGSNPGSDGSNLVPPGGFSGTANNQGAARANGGQGSITISYYTP